MITVLHRCRLLQQHIEQSLVGCAEGLDSALILHTVLIVGLDGEGVAADDLTGGIVLDLEGLDHQLSGHGTSKDDIQNGVAYALAGPAVEKILAENPSIEVVIDLHRDGVGENTHLVTNIDGVDMAKIMFVNGLSRTTSVGEIGYLYNPNLADNLAFSFQTQLTTAEYYPGLSRGVYLKGYRYNLHYCPKSLLVEVGAQTNTVQEAMNAMVPLADILNKVVTGETGM